MLVPILLIIWVRPHSSSGSQKRTAEDSNYPERRMLPMPNLWTNMCVENWTVLPLSHASTLTTIRDPSCRWPSPTVIVNGDCCNSQASIRLEMTPRNTQPHVAQSHWIRSETTEHRSFLCMEEDNLSRTLAFDCGHGYAQEDYAMKREREREVEKAHKAVGRV